MKTRGQRSFTSTLSIDISNDSYVSANGSNLETVTTAEFNKSQYTISCLSTKYFINSTISISKNIPDADLYDAIYSKVYDELGLDQAIAYQLGFVEIFNKFDENNRNFYVFIIDPQDLSVAYTSAIQKIKYLDYILPQPLLYKSLYTLDILERGDTHCFIYIQKNDSTITIYNDSEIIYTKSLNYSLSKIHERFCEISGEAIDYASFERFLINENLKTTNSDFKLDILKVYKEVLSNINDILTYAKRALEIDKIHCVYIDTAITLSSKLDEITETELNIKSSSFNFHYNFSGNNIGHIHSLLQAYATLPSTKRYECNFSIFSRPPKFTQRSSGKALILSVASLMLAFLYPLSYFFLTYAQNIQYKMLENEYADIHTQKTTREININQKESEKQENTKLLTLQKDEYAQKKATLIKIKDVKVNYPMKVSLLNTLSKELNKFDVKVEHILYEEQEAKNQQTDNLKEFKLGLVSSSDKKITSLIEYLTKAYDGKFGFLTEIIYFDSESKLYFSELKVSLL